VKNYLEDVAKWEGTVYAYSCCQRLRPVASFEFDIVLFTKNSDGSVENVFGFYRYPSTVEDSFCSTAFYFQDVKNRLDKSVIKPIVWTTNDVETSRTSERFEPYKYEGTTVSSVTIGGFYEFVINTIKSLVAKKIRDSIDIKLPSSLRYVYIRNVGEVPFDTVGGE
jgi:hypothetical protein